MSAEAHEAAAAAYAHRATNVTGAAEHSVHAREHRKAKDGESYTFTQFTHWYGIHALRMWNECQVVASDAEADAHQAGATEHRQASTANL